jgi:hypothetical protein
MGPTHPDDTGFGVHLAQSISLKLDDFFAERGMRSIICKNVQLQPDHFSFDKEGALRVLRENADIDPKFAHTYSVFIEIFESIRGRLATFALSSKDRLDIIKSAIALCVARGHSTFDSGRPNHLAAMGRPLTSTDIHTLRDIQGSDGNAYTSDEILEAIFDLLKSILDYCEYLAAVPAQDTNPGYDLASLFTIFHQYSIYKADWEECLWLGNDADLDKKEMMRNSALVARAIGLSREFSLRFQHILKGGVLSSEVAKHRFLSGRMRPSRKTGRDFAKFRKSILGQIPYPFLLSMVMREMEAGSEISRIIDLYLLLNFISLGNINRIEGPPPTDSFVFSEAEFETYLSDQLSLSRDQLKGALTWLRFRPGQREDIWFTPLYWIEHYYVLLSPMCAYPNLERFIESIFARVSESNSGEEFERYVVRRSHHAIKNPRLPKITISGPVALKGKDGKEEIDLLLGSETALFVGEVKYDCFASDEINVYQHIAKMRRACEQAARKANYVRGNWAILAPTLGVRSEAKNVYPFALTEKPFLSGFSCRECRLSPFVTSRIFLMEKSRLMSLSTATVLLREERSSRHFAALRR